VTARRAEARAVFLDRDGVLNAVVMRGGRPSAPRTLAEFEILPGVSESLAALRAAGFLLVVASNQPDVARGLVTRETVEGMHDRLRAALPLDDVRVCWEIETPTSTCYKPKPGMLIAAADERGIDLRRSYMVGDRWRDVGAGKAAGCFTVFVDRGYGEVLRDRPDAVCKGLAEAAEIILSRDRQALAGGAR